MTSYEKIDKSDSIDLRKVTYLKNVSSVIIFILVMDLNINHMFVMDVMILT